MKIKRLKFKQILKLHLLSSQAYKYAEKKISSGILTDFNLTQVISGLKKALHIIFEYNQANKTILFIGVPKKLELKINRLTAHSAVPYNFDLQGVIANNVKSSKLSKVGNQHSSKLYLKSLMPKLQKKPDLVVLFSHEKKQAIINESYVSKVPVIAFNSDGVSEDIWSNNFYNFKGVDSNSTTAFNKNLFFLGLNFLFKNFKKKSQSQTTSSNFNLIRKKRFK
uniref:Ribosomal protein S2 n=1 Tax=Nitzschia sp. (in: diatoms) TaxID=1884248 RepID=A0A2U9GJ68_9STRA|nr:ribosomal protein S2 [Nitzschia sp. (in: diatoms)]AWQ64285.1 ribosomal protein S2 [Nitzschia sp. (in: diatoms)]